MKTMSLLMVSIVLSLSICFTTQIDDEKPYERNYSLEGLPVYLKVESRGTNQPSPVEYHLDTTILVFFIKQSVAPDGWHEEGIKISATNHKGVDVLKIVQTPENHEKITEILSKLRKASSYYVEDRLELFGSTPAK